MKKYILLAVIILFIALGSFGVVKANSSRFAAPAVCTTSGTLSTSSISYMTPGTGTTTLPCNLQNAANLSSGVDSMDSAILAVQFHASSTVNTALNFVIQVSQDGKDWYSEPELTIKNATTSILVGGDHIYNWTQYATTTSYSSNGLATSSVNMKYYSLPTDTKFVRSVFSLPIGSANGGVWAQIVGKAERIDK